MARIILRWERGILELWLVWIKRLSRFDPLNGYIWRIFIIGSKSVTSFYSSRSTEARKILERFIVKRGSTISDRETETPVQVEVEEEENDPMMVENFTSSKWSALNVNWVLKIMIEITRVMRIKEWNCKYRSKDRSVIFFSSFKNL